LNTTAVDSVETAGVPIGPFVREQILTRLRAALHLATEDLPANLGRVRELAAEVAERADGIDLPAAAMAGREAQPSSRLTYAMLATARGAPVSEFLLIPFGDVVVERPVAGESFVFTRGHAEAAQRWFDGMGRKLAIDYEHQSFDRCNTRSDGLRPAAGWIGGLEIRDDGLWAVNESWTERAAELLRSGEYRYFSPVIFWTDEDHSDLAALGPVALTNDPAMRGVRPLAASRQPEAPDEDDEQLRAELETAREQVALLRRQLAAQEADAFVERGLRLGKILDSTSMDWRADYLRDAEETEQRLSRAPTLRPPGRVITLDRRGEVSGPHRPANRTALAGPWAIDAEDWAAYERAVAAGRVK
jgi:phage I-like protein